MASYLERETSVYLIQSADSGKVYVGISGDPQRRWWSHKGSAKGGHRNTPLYRSMRKYGVDRHQLSILEVQPTFADAMEAEVFWIAYLRGLGASLFNVGSGGESLAGTPGARARMGASHVGKRLSPEHRARIAAGQANRPPHSEETREKMRSSAAVRWADQSQRDHLSQLTKARMTPEARAHLSSINTGKTPSEETRAKMRESHAARPPCSDETRRKLSESKKGSCVSEEAKAKISAANKGKKRTPEQLERLRAERKCRVITPEQREAMAQRCRQRVWTPEQRAKISAANRRRARDGGKQ